MGWKAYEICSHLATLSNGRLAKLILIPEVWIQCRLVSPSVEEISQALDLFGFSVIHWYQAFGLEEQGLTGSLLVCVH